MARRRKRRRGADGVELNLAAMLDMAFQLLAFFILTYNPQVIEKTVAMKLRKAALKSTNAGAQNQQKEPDTEPIFEKLHISIGSNAQGEIASLECETTPARNLEELGAVMGQMLKDSGAGGKNGIDHIVLQIGPQLKWQSVVRVMDVCLRQKLPSGERVTKVSPVLLKKTN